MYGHTVSGKQAVEIVSDRKGASWTLMLMCSLEGLDYARIVLENIDMIEFPRIFGQAQRFPTPFGRRMYSVDDHTLDNASNHRFEGGDDLVQWLANRNCWLIYMYTPVYSPEFNVAELVFNYLKTTLKLSPYRQFAKQDLPATVFAILSGITPQHMFEFFKEFRYLKI